MTFGGECVKINTIGLISKGFPVIRRAVLFRVLICLSILAVSVRYEDESRTHARESGGMERFLAGGALLALTCFVAGLAQRIEHRRGFS